MSGSSLLENTGEFLWLSRQYGLLHIDDQTDFLLTQVPIDPNGHALHIFLLMFQIPVETAAWLTLLLHKPRKTLVSSSCQGLSQ